MLDCPANQEDDGNSVVDGMKCLAECCVHLKTPEVFQPLLQTAQKLYPKLHDRLAEVCASFGLEKPT